MTAPATDPPTHRRHLLRKGVPPGPEGYDVDLQVSDWRLDTEGKIRMRPDIVISRLGRVVAVAYTRYNVWGEGDGSPPNADVYQSLAYAVTAGVGEVHLLYVSGNVEPRRYEIPSTGTAVVAQAINLSGEPTELVDRVRGIGTRTVPQLELSR